MNPIELKIIFGDGSEESVTAIAADIIAFEERFDMSISALQNNVRMTHLFFMAWHAAKRTGKTSDEFDKWVEGVGMVSIGDAKK
jgi:hypothetical protein